MQKNTLKISFYLITFSFIAKLLSFLSRIVLARNISASAMSIYSILSPTIVILITSVQMSIPLILSKFVARKGYTYKDVTTSIYFNMCTTLLTSSIYIVFIPYLTQLLYKTDYKSVFYCVLPYLPLVALSGLLKGYMMGIQKFVYCSFSQVLEEIVRIVFLLICFHYYNFTNAVSMVKLAIIAMIIGELFSCLYMLIVILLKKNNRKITFSFSKESLKCIIDDAIPLSGSRFIGSISYFLEPILMNLNLSLATTQQIQIVYGSINGYILPLLTMPSFLTNAFSSYLLSAYSYHYSRNNTRYANKLLFTILYFCLLTNTIYCLFLYFFSDQICMFLYHTIEPSIYLKQCAIPFIIFALQPISANILNALNLSKLSTFDTFLGSITRLLIVTFLTPIIKEKALVLALCSGMYVTTTLHVFRICNQKKRYT